MIYNVPVNFENYENIQNLIKDHYKIVGGFKRDNNKIDLLYYKLDKNGKAIETTDIYGNLLK